MRTSYNALSDVSFTSSNLEWVANLLESKISGVHEVSGQGAVVRGRGQEVDLGTHVVAARLTELTHPARDVWVHGHTVTCQGWEGRNDKIRSCTCHHEKECDRWLMLQSIYQFNAALSYTKRFFFQAKYKHTLKTLRSLPRYIGVNSEVENTYTLLTLASLVLVLKKKCIYFNPWNLPTFSTICYCEALPVLRCKTPFLTWMIIFLYYT